MSAMRIVILRTFLSIVLIFPACKALDIVEDKRTTRSKVEEELLFKMEEKTRPENLLVDNGNLKIYGASEANLKTRIFIKKGEFIFISGRYLGFELFRLKLSNDSVKYINRMQRNYFFGPSNNAFRGINNFITLEELQEIIYTGLLKDENINKKSLWNHFSYNEGDLKYQKVINEGLKVELDYNSDTDLKKIILTDHNNGIYFIVNIIRENGNIKKLKGEFYNNEIPTSWEMDISDIEYVEYNNTEFNIGNNYYQLPYVL